MDEVEYRRAVGRRLMLKRKDLGLSQVEVARLTGISHPSISNMERGVQGISLFMARKISRGLGVSLDWLANPEGEL